MRTVVFVGLLAVLVGCLRADAYDVKDLEQIASTEAVLEISQAAGLALVDVYVATKTASELADLAASTRPGIAYAAQMALRALDDPAKALLLSDSDDLRNRAQGAATPEERLDAARAYFLAGRASATVGFLEEQAATDEAPEWALAAGEMLGGYYAAYGVVSVEELLDLVATSPHAGIRRAASVALTALWAANGLALSDVEIETKLVELTQWRPDLASAYMGVLAHRFIMGLESW
jgi:hypothetical protein